MPVPEGCQMTLLKMLHQLLGTCALMDVPWICVRLHSPNPSPGHFGNVPFPNSGLEQSETLVLQARSRERAWQRREKEIKMQAAPAPKARSCHMQPDLEGPGQAVHRGSTHVCIQAATSTPVSPASQSNPRKSQHGHAAHHPISRDQPRT